MGSEMCIRDSNSIDAICSTNNGVTDDDRIVITTLKLDNTVQVTVTDTGPGIPSDVSLFKSFETTKDDGLGIGLSISRSIIESHKGNLWHNKSIEAGCAMSFTLPIDS